MIADQNHFLAQHDRHEHFRDRTFGNFIDDDRIESLKIVVIIKTALPRLITGDPDNIGMVNIHLFDRFLLGRLGLMQKIDPFPLNCQPLVITADLIRIGAEPVIKGIPALLKRRFSHFRDRIRVELNIRTCIGPVGFPYLLIFIEIRLQLFNPAVTVFNRKPCFFDVCLVLIALFLLLIELII